MANAVLARTPPQFTIFRTITLGLLKTPDQYREALKSAGRGIGVWGDDILDRITCSQQEVQVDLVRPFVGDLGFKDGAYYEDICTNDMELGLELCPAEVGPALRLQYVDQPRGELLHVAMKAITDRNGRRLIFAVDHSFDGELWLIGGVGGPDRFFNAGFRFLFVQPRK